MSFENSQFQHEQKTHIEALYPWLPTVSKQYPNNGEYVDAVESTLEIYNEFRKIKLKIQSINNGFSLLKKEPSTTFSNTSTNDFSNNISAEISKLKSALKKRKEIKTALKNGENPTQYLQETRVSVTQSLQWKISSNYRNNQIYFAGQEIEKLNESIRNSIQEIRSSLLNTLEQKLQSFDITTTTDSSDFLSSLEKFNALAPLLKDTYKAVCETFNTLNQLGLKDEFSRTKDLCDFKLSSLVSKLEESFSNLCNRYQRDFSESLKESINTIANLFFVRKNTSILSEDNIDLPQALLTVPSISDLNLILKAFNEIEYDENVREIAYEDFAKLIENNRNYILRKLVEYKTSCDYYGSCLVTHNTANELAKKVVISGKLASSYARKEQGETPIVSSKMGTEMPLYEISLSISGIELQYGGEISKISGVVAERKQGDLRQFDQDSIVFVMPFSKAVKDLQYLVTGNTQSRLSGNFHELQVYQAEFYQDLHNFNNLEKLGAEISIADAKILIPDTREDEWRTFLLKSTEEDGAGKDNDWISANVLFYPANEGISAYFFSNKQNLFDGKNRGFFGLSGNMALEGRIKTEPLLTWHSVI